jgi:hypothetical protein
MAISGDYSSPVQVNGFQCKNCTDVDYAKKHIDPAHPKSGPYGVNAATDPSQTKAVILSGALKGSDSGDAANAPQEAPSTGAQFDITV